MPAEAAGEVPDNELRLSFWNLPENVGVARVVVAAFAGHLDFTLQDLEEIKVAVSEAVTNAVVHAYPSGRGDVVMVVRRWGDTLEVEVRDFGCGIPDVTKAREPTFTTDPERMGLGFSFMETFSDLLEVQSKPNAGTWVRMRRRALLRETSPET